MTKGGFIENNKAYKNHLFKPKWRLGKTIAIRIPEILETKILEVAKYLDSKSKTEVENTNFIELLEENNKLKVEVYNLQNEKQKLQQEIDNLSKTDEVKNNSNSIVSKVDKYQIAVECFGEYVKNYNLTLEELSTSRKGSKKHQLWLINNWFQSHSRDRKN